MRIRKISKDMNEITIGLFNKIIGIDKVLAEMAFYLVSKERR